MNLRRFMSISCIAPNQPNINVEEDEVYRILNARRRRLLLLELADYAGGEYQLNELAKDVAARETETSRAEVSEEACKRTSIALHQTHVPLLDCLGIVRWDRAAKTVCCGHSVSPLANMIREIEQQTK